MTQDIVDRLKIRADIRRNAKGRKSLQLNQPDRLSDLLEEAANEIQSLRSEIDSLYEDMAGASL